MKIVRYSRYFRAPIFVWWDITKKCNFKCKQCYSDSGKPSQNELTTEEVFDIIEQLAQLQIFYIYFLGGEPLLRKDFFKILKKCQEVGIATMFSTNGWFVTKRVASELCKLSVQIVRVSLDGASPEVHDGIRGIKGSFVKALHAVKVLKEAGVPSVGVSPTLLQENYFQIDQIISLAAECGADEVQVVQLCSTGRGKNTLEPTFKQFQSAREQVLRALVKYKKTHITATEGILRKECEHCISKSRSAPSFVGCTGGRSCAAINETGKVYPCILYRRVAGDLRAQRFKEIWKKSPLFKSMRRIKEECMGCSYADFCGRICPLSNKDFPADKNNFLKETGGKSITRRFCEKRMSGGSCMIRF